MNTRYTWTIPGRRGKEGMKRRKGEAREKLGSLVSRKIFKRNERGNEGKEGAEVFAARCARSLIAKEARRKSEK